MARPRRESILRIVLTVLVAGGNVLAWLIRTNVAYAVAQNREVLLGRYTVGQFSGLFVLFLLSVPVVVLVWTQRGRRRRRCVGLLVMTLSVLLAAFVVDLVLRFVLPQPYVSEGDVEHRRPNAVFTGVTRDVPKTPCAYPAVWPGHPDVPYKLTTDSRGFRNSEALNECDVLVIGDSFAEGSEISDEQTWPALVAGRSGKRVYNLGMAGGGPRKYRVAIEQIGLGLKPKIVLLMLYEGNDFRADRKKTRTGLGQALRVYRKRSPILTMLKQAMVRSLGRVGAVRMETVPEDHPLWPIAWQPVAVPVGSLARYYALEWKRLAAHWTPAEALRESSGFQAALGLVAEMNALCRERGIRLVVLFAPDKPHVVLPLVRDRVSAEQLRAFLALKLKHLPAAKACFETLMTRLDACESAVADFCRAESIGFHSLTVALRQEVAAGRQVYFTYDQHWTPVGNRVVAESVAALLAEDRSAP